MAMRSLLSHPRQRLLYHGPHPPPSLCHRWLPSPSSPSRAAGNLQVPASLRLKARLPTSLSVSFRSASKRRPNTSSSGRSSGVPLASSDSISSIDTRTSTYPTDAVTKKLKPKPKPKHKQDSTFSVPVLLEDSLETNPELERLLEQLDHDGPLMVKLAAEGIDNLAFSKIVELSLLICDDSYIQNLNKEWRGKNYPTDVLSFPQDQPPGVSSLWLLGDVIISIDTAKRQAQERGHDLLDEVRILLVHGLLHVLGFDHEEGLEAAAAMEKEELRILQGLGWNSKGLITASLSETTQDMHQPFTSSREYAGPWRRRPLFKVVLCDMDGTLLNSKSKITENTAAAMKEAVARGVKVFIATGKTRPAVITACQSAGLVGEVGVISDTSPGVFVQGLLVYGQYGKVVHNQLLSPDVCRKAFQYSLAEKRPLLGFSGDRIVTLFDHPLIENLHTFYMEPKAEVAPSLEYILENFNIQKLLFADTADQVSKVIRPYWSKELGHLARVVQAQDDMLEIIPVDSSKGKGVKILLNDLGIDPDEVMAIGDGENDIEMLELVGWGVAMGNATPQTRAVANAHVASNNEDGVVEALERFVFT